jgi:hypothetical protein
MPALLSSVFERGVVYADKWAPDVREALDIADPLTEKIVAALQGRQIVLISGNAGDGKSHLAQQALARLPNRTCLEVSNGTRIGAEVPAETVVFVRDASALLDEAIINAVNDARAYGLALLITINEGPLASLASVQDGAFFKAAKDVIHARTQGEAVEDPPNTLLLNLAGRQLARSDFAVRALEMVLQNVTPCATCGKNKNCPRVKGAAMLRKSRRAKERIPLLLQLLSGAGSHLTARDLWVFFIDLFFGHTCPTEASSQYVDGYFWMRLFDDDTPLCRALGAAFDPIKIPMPSVDGALWVGNFAKIAFDVTYPGPSPVVSHRESETLGMLHFASAKRAYFLFGKDVDVSSVLSQHSSAPRYQNLLNTAVVDPRAAARQIVHLLNKYRIASTTETELWVSRHHGMAAQRRPAALAAADKAPIDALKLRIPHSDDSARHPASGYFPDRLLLSWTDRGPTFTIDFATWLQLQRRRTLTVDRKQEMLDFAIDLFMAQAPVGSTDDPEIRVYDHRDRSTYQFRVRHEDRGLEVLS